MDRTYANVYGHAPPSLPPSLPPLSSRFKMEGDVNGWLVMDAATGEIKTKAALDRETVEVLELTIIAFEKGETAVENTHLPDTYIEY